MTPKHGNKRASSPKVENRTRSKTLQNEKYEEMNKEQMLQKSIRILQKPLIYRSVNEKMLINQLLSNIKYFVPLFASKQQLVYDISEALQYKRSQPQEMIFKQGDLGDLFYIVLSGVVSVRINIPQGEEFVVKEVATISEGGSFGELALQSSQARTATVVAVTECHFATIEKTTYRQLIGDYNKNQLDQKIAFLSKYPWFQQWSLREMKMLAYELYEKQYDFGDKIQINDYIGMIVKGQVELKRIVEKRGFQDHPLKISKILKQQLSIEVLDESKMIGELNFLDKDGNLKFMINKFNKPYVKSAADPNTKEFITQSNNKSLYEAICHSNHATIYLLKVSTIEDRFFDQYTRTLFQTEIKKMLNVRIKKALALQQEFDKQYQENLEEQQIQMRLSNYHSRKSTPVKMGSIVRSNNDEELMKDYEIRQKIEKNLPNGILYRYKRMYELEEKSQYIKVMEEKYEKLKTEENEAQENLKQTSVSMNCSYYRIKSHFQKQRLNKLFFQAYLGKQE